MIKDRFCFRGFHKEENGKETIYIDRQAYKGKWVEGYYHKEVSTSITLQQYGINEMENHYIHTVIDHLPYKLEVIPETIGQYTGINDMNDKKIFENDVVKAINNFSSCSDEYVEGQVYFDMFDGIELKSSEDEIIHFDYLEEMEVIGTIWDSDNYDS